MTRPRLIDCEARVVREQLELAAARGDADLALEAARRFTEQGLAISVHAPDFAGTTRQQHGAVETSPSGFVGSLITSKFLGACAVCAGPVSAGERVLWARGAGVAHRACGKEA